MRRIKESVPFGPARVTRMMWLLATVGMALPSGAHAQSLTLEAALVSSGAETVAASPVRVDATVGQSAVGRSGRGTLAVELGFFGVGGMTGVAAEDEAGPAVFALEANYPNPFARSTTIAYALPAAEDVRLDVFDVLGRRVRTLVDAEQGTGRHRITLEAEGLASGVYLYRLTAGSRTATRRLQIVR